MRIIALLFICICAIAWSSTTANAYTLTFDEFPSGTELRDSFYHEQYGARFSEGFWAVGHTDSNWGYPHSGSNVLMWDGDYSPGYLLFGHYTYSTMEPYSVYSVGAYFSTQPGAMVKITAYQFDRPDTATLIDSVIIGSLGQSWDNQYVEIGSSNGVFNLLQFEGVNSLDDLRGFCADDMTVVPVPEPSSLAALAFGLLPIGVAAIRRRRK